MFLLYLPYPHCFSSFTRGQKRASVLLSDVSQSIASVLSPSPLSSGGNSPSSMRSPTSSYFSPLPSSPLTSYNTASSSLLDEDPEDLSCGNFMKASPVMTPEIKPSFSRRNLDVAMPKSSSPSRSPKASIPSKVTNEDEEWNW